MTSERITSEMIALNEHRDSFILVLGGHVDVLSHEQMIDIWEATPVRHTVALFGGGRIGSLHYRHLQFGGRVIVKWLVEEDLVRANALVSSLQMEGRTEVLHPKDAHKVFNDQSVEAVFVCTPHTTHEEIVQKALNAGKAVFCEKPLSLTLDGATRMYDLADANNKPLFCAFNRRYDPQARAIYNRVRSGEVGKIYMAKTISRDLAGFSSKEYHKISGGFFLDSSVHDIDMVCWQVGEKPESVTVVGSAMEDMFKELGIMDTVSITLKFPSGALGIIDQSRHAPYGADQRLEVFGKAGLLQSENISPTGMLAYGKEGITADPMYQGIDRYENAYRLEKEHFLDVLEGKKDIEVDRTSTLMGLRVALACKESLDSGRTINVAQYWN